MSATNATASAKKIRVKMGNSITDSITNAYRIALSDLKSNYRELGIYAGPKNHREYWARDSFFASFGCCAVGDYVVSYCAASEGCKE